MALPADWKGNPDGTPRSVSAAAVLQGEGRMNDPVKAAAVEAAMSQAVLDCLAEGITMDQSEVIQQRMLEARDRVLAG